MSIRLRFLVVAATFALVYLGGVPIAGYFLNHAEAQRNHALIVRLAADEQQTHALVVRLTTDEATLKAQAAATKRTQCLAGNDFRMQDADLWHFILTSFANPHPTAEETHRTQQFSAFLRVHDRQRTC